jgi:putative thiamine transport system ATP-binding protein
VSGAPLILERVWLGLGQRRLMAPLSLTVAPGAVVIIMGPSGSGKSSLLAFLCGTLPAAFASGGRVLLGAQDLGPLPPERRRLGILFQDDLLFPHLTVGENVAFGLPPGPRAERRARVAAALAEAGLAGFADRDPLTLSGGQRARVALLRTLAADPRALLLDEPFARLDSELRNRFRSFVFEHGRRRGLPILLVTHDREDAAAAGGPVLEIVAPATRAPLPDATESGEVMLSARACGSARNH